MNEKFFNEVVPVIVKVAKERGYKFPSAIIAQAACESAWGKSTLASQYFNYFGMKCGSSWTGKVAKFKTKEEYKQGQLTTIWAEFRAYSSLEEGINGYFDFIQMKRYQNLKEATSPEDYIEKLKADGWATSFSYVNTLKSILNTNGLKKYDDPSVVIKTDEQLSADKTEFRNLSKKLQQILNKYGAGLVEDGIIGTKTFNAIQIFLKK